MDGTPVETVPVELDGVDGTVVLTRVRVVPVRGATRASPTAACLQGRARGFEPGGRAVERVGVRSASVTLRDVARHQLFACDDSPGAREGDRRWCGGSFGKRVAGRLPDPRLDLGCTTRDGRPLGFVWVEPARDARYVVVEHDGYAEAYVVAEDLPVRVASDRDVSLEGARASFSLSEHDRAGRLLRRHRLEAVVAG
jgi:hypothetical protein